jgi:hypothetical protein
MPALYREAAVPEQHCRSKDWISQTRFTGFTKTFAVSEINLSKYCRKRRANLFSDLFDAVFKAIWVD